MASAPADAGFDADATLMLADDQRDKDRLCAETEATVARGVFGAPTIFVGDAMLFVQDWLTRIKAAAA